MKITVCHNNENCIGDLYDENSVKSIFVGDFAMESNDQFIVVNKEDKDKVIRDRIVPQSLTCVK